MITLVITANKANYLTEALLSVAAQTCKDFNLICCADVKTNDIPYLLFKEFAQYIQCSNMEIIKVIGNGTAGYVRNKGFEVAKTEWVCYLDGDDIITPNAIEVLIKYIHEMPDIDIFSSGMIRIEQNGEITKWEDSLNYYPPINIYEIDPDLIGEPTYFNQLQCIRKLLWENYNYSDKTNGEDIDFILHQLLMGKYYKIPKYLYGYRNTPESFSKEKYENDCDICTLRYNENYYKDYYDKNYSEVFKDNFRRISI